MFVQRTKTATIEAASEVAAIQEAMRVLEQHHRKPTVQRWVCEVCGMIHTGSLPQACDSCGSDVSLVQLSDFRTEMNSRW
jgi:rubrerythrin